MKLSADYLTIPDSILAIQREADGKPLRAFHGSAELAEFYRARVKAHAEADELIHGVYWERGKGCAVGCTLHSGNHADYETQLGFPLTLARLEDGIFEALPNGESKRWPIDFLNAPKPGADLILVWPRFAHWLLVDPKDGVIQYAKTERTKTAIQSVAELFSRWIGGNKPSADEWRAAYAAADAAAYAADAAAYAAADAAAYAAADAAAYAADAAAYAADAAAAAARWSMRRKQAAKLIELMKAAPML